ncbi:MAG: binding-protein-dependent transport system inner rane component [Burkholderia sp.]|nr:binding-protein-dependent transport system inner rane component [Burkholderia sp.]
MRLRLPKNLAIEPMNNPLSPTLKLAARPVPLAQHPRRRLDATLLVFVLLLLILVALVANPVLRLVWESLRAPDGSLTLAHYADAFGKQRNLKALLNTLYLGLASTGMAVAFGVPLAWAVSRTTMPGRRLMQGGVLATFVMPPFLGAVAWILLAGPNAGWLNKRWAELTGADGGPFNIFSFWGIALLIALYAFPLVFVFSKSAFDLISTEMEDAAAIHGAGSRQVFMRVTLPLALPAIVGSAILVFLEAISLFGTPALLGIPARINVATTQMSTFFEHPLRMGTASAYSMPVLGATVLLLLLQRRLLAKKGFVSVSGKGGERRPLEIGPFKWVLAAYGAAILLLSVVLPLGILLQSAFAKAWGKGLAASNLTLANFNYIFFEQMTVRQAMQNTVLYALAAAAACVVLGVVVAYVTQRRLLPGPLPGLIQFMALAPFAVPGIILAVGFYAAYAGAPFSLYGSGWLIVLAYITRFLPIAATTAGASLRSLNPELEEAVRILGGGRFMVLRKVVVPLLRKSLIGAFMLVFVIATRELSTAVFLTGPQSRVMSVLTLDMSEQGQYEILSAMGIVLLLMTTIVVGIGMKLAGRDFMLRRH